MPTNARSIPGALAVLLGSTLALPPAASAALDAQPAAGRQAADAPFALQPQRTSFPILGMSVRLPEGAVLQTSELGTNRQSITLIAPGGEWTIRVLDRRSGDRLSSPFEVATELQKELVSTRQAVDPRTGRQAAAVSVEPIEDDLTVGQAPAARFYAGFISTANQPVVAGYTIALAEPGRFLIFQLEAPSQQTTRATDLYERMLETVEMRNPGDVAAQRVAAVRAGNAFLASLPASEYLAALPRDPVRWTRTVTKDPSSTDGFREVAYQRVEMRTGKRGELNPARPSSRWTPSEMEDGVLVKIEARAVAPAGSGLQIVDSQSISWLKLDSKGRGEEAWSLRMVLRERGRDSVYSEVGARLGDQLVVTVNAPGAQPIEKSWKIPSEGYLSQAETHLLPRLLARAGVLTDMAFYAYSSSLTEIKLRTERLTRLDPTDASDETLPPDAVWTLSSEITEGLAPRVLILNSEGDVLQGRMPDQSMVAPSNPEEIRAIWRRKGLPTDMGTNPGR
ncbi:MAG: hypothetical protein KF684_04910 [Phycisphaeraceae bacterium]|nr:hypothetical protein [Phycisphaeraceae bacterium]